MAMSKELPPVKGAATDQPTEPAEPAAKPDHFGDFEAWLKERGLIIAIVAQGKSGTLSPADDFMPSTHVATFTFMKAQPR